MYTYLDALMMGCKKETLLLHLIMQADKSLRYHGKFHHVTHNIIDYGLQETPAIRCYEHMYNMPNYAEIRVELLY